MKKNIGNTDKVIRVIASLLVIVLAFNLEAPFSYILLGVAGILLVTILIGTCPLYLPFGFNTCKKI